MVGVRASFAGEARRVCGRRLWRKVVVKVRAMRGCGCIVDGFGCLEKGRAGDGLAREGMVAFLITKKIYSRIIMI